MTKIINPYIFKKYREIVKICRNINIDRLYLFGSGTTMHWQHWRSDIDFGIYAEYSEIGKLKNELYKLFPKNDIQVINMNNVYKGSKLFSEIEKGVILYDREIDTKRISRD